MLRLYYMIWSDMINTAEKNKGEWKIAIFILPVIQGVNLVTLLILWITIFGPIDSPFPEIYIFHNNDNMNSFINGFIYYFLPFTIFNYFMIMYKDKYKVIIKKYPSKNGKIYITYLVLSFLAFFVPIIISKMLS